MDIEITNRREKALMDQEVIELDINHTGEATPTADAVRRKVAAELDLDPLTIAVDGIHSSSGSGVATGRVTVHPEQVIEEMADEDAADEASGEDADGADEEPDEAEDEGTDDAGEAEDDSDDEEADDEEPDEDEAAEDEDAEDDETEEEK